jgi:lipopolysaccharide transport system ATP-binding protein
MSTVIKVTNLSKIYRLGQIGTGTISRDLERWYKMRIRGQEDPFLKIGESNQRDKKGVSDVVYALKDINFEVQQGVALGIIGKNGAGKSTLLKIISRITSPTTGKIKIKGRVASLLEVGTGFHPELTGRENIFLNGAILGMRKKEIIHKLDEIIDFSGVERYIDTPVKRYSSGMYVRLAFAVAAHLESEILIVDEVLAVGDDEFQKKCIGKIDNLSKNEGRTVLFVSHNMTAIRNLCKNAILIKNGMISSQSEVNEVVQTYLSFNDNMNLTKYWDFIEAPGNQFVKIISVKLADRDGELLRDLNIEKNLFIEIEFYVLNDNEYVGLTLLLLDRENNLVLSSINNHEKNYYGKPLEKGSYKSICSIPPNLLNSINYSIDLILFSKNFTNLIRVSNVLFFSLEDPGLIRKDYFGGFAGAIRPFLDWKTLKINLNDSY